MIILDDWQKNVLAHKGDLILCTGRRVGKTYILARKAIDAMVNDKKNVLIFSLTEEQAMLIIAMAKLYLEERYPNLVNRKHTETNKKTITLKNKACLKCRPAGDTGDSGRGFEADIVIVDEASRMNKLFWISVLPIILMKAGEVWLASTPHGKQGYFWEQFNLSYNLKDPNARYKVFYTSTEQVIKERQITKEWTLEHRDRVLKILEQDRKSMSALEYGQEYQGLFLDDLQQYFSDDLINKVCTLQRNTCTSSGTNFMGCDIARFGGDEISYEIIKRTGKNSYVHIESIVKKNQDTTVTEADIISYTEIFQCLKVGIDAGSGSLGVGIFDRLMQNDTMKRKTIPMNNREISLDREGKKKQRIMKEDFYDNLKGMMERNELKLLNDENIKLSLKSVQMEFDKDTNKVRIFGNYTHIAEGLTRASWLAKKEKVFNLWISYI